MPALLYRLSFYRAVKSLDELENLLATQRGALDIKLLFRADSAWSNQAFDTFSVELVPGIDAALAYADALRSLDPCPYTLVESFLGIPMDEAFPDFNPPPPPAQDEQPVYRVYLSRPTAQMDALDPETYETMQTCMLEAFQSCGARNLLSAYARWNSEDWEYFGIQRFPSLEALITYTQSLTENHWYQVSTARSLLGLATGGLLSGLEKPPAGRVTGALKLP